MRIVNNRHLFNSIFTCYNAYLFSGIPKKSNRVFQLHSLEQQLKEDVQHFSFNKSSRIQRWKISRTSQRQQLIEEDHQIQHLGLKHLQEAFKSRMTESQLKKTRFQSHSLSNQTKKSNSQKFIKLLTHSVSKEGCVDVINLIQAYCEELRIQNQQKMNLIPSGLRNYDASRKSQEVLFKKIKQILLDDMLLDQKTMKQNTEYVNSLMKILAEADLSSISQQELEQSSTFGDYFDYQPKEIRTFLHNQYLNQSSTLQEARSHQKKSQSKQHENENKLQQTLKIRQSEKSTKIFVKSPRQGAHKQIKIKVAPEQDIFFTKILKKNEDFTYKMQQSKKYAYLYDLPYSVPEAQCKDLINHLQTSKGVKVQSYKLLSYDNYLQMQNKEKSFHVPQYFQVDGYLLKVYDQIDVDTYLNPEKSLKNTKGKSSSTFTSTTEALLKKIKRQKYSLLNRSVLILKFASEEQKNKLANPELRLYGINFKHLRNVKFQQGFSKTVLKVHGIPSGCTTTAINEFINKVLEPLNISLSVQNDLYLSKNYILIQLQHFSQVLKAMDLVHNTQFQEKTLKAEIYYGSSKVFKGEFSTSMLNSKEKLKQKVVEISKKYYKINEESQN